MDETVFVLFANIVINTFAIIYVALWRRTRSNKGYVRPHSTVIAGAQDSTFISYDDIDYFQRSLANSVDIHL